MDSSLVEAKHDLNSTTAWLLLAEFVVPTTPTATKVYAVRNTEDVTFNEQVYTAFPFELGATNQVSKGDISRLEFKISNVSRTVQGYLEAYDGLVGQPVTIRVVAKPAGESVYHEAVSWDYEVLGCQADVMWVTFSLGIPNPIGKRFPLFRYIANHCSWTFNSPTVRAAGTNAGVECGYTGADTTCKRTLADCQAKANSGRYGGYVGMGSGGIRLV